MKNIGKAFSFVFDDPQWLTKVLVGGLMVLSCVLVIPLPFVIGYLVQLRTNVINGQSPVLPEWTNLGEMYKKGLVLALGMILYSLIGAILRKGGLPFFKLFGFLYQILMVFYLPVVSVFYAKEQTFESMFKIGEILQFISKNFVDLLVFWLLHFVLAIIAVMGLIGLIIGVVFTAFYSALVQAYLYATLYRDKT